MGLDLTKFYNDNNFKFDKKMAYGIYRNRVISILSTSMYIKVTIAFNRQIFKEAGSNLNTKMKELKQKYRAIQNALTTNVMEEIVLYKSADINDEFLKILDECIDAISLYVYETCEICPICGMNLSSDAPFMRIRDCVVQAHNECIEKTIATTKGMEQRFNPPSKKQTLISVLITIAVMVLMVGIMCLAATFNFFDYIVAISGWVMIGITKLLLFRFRIRLDKKKAMMVLSLGVLCLLLSVFLGSIILISMQSTFTFIQVITNYFKLLKENFDTFTKFLLYDLLFGFLFIGFSIFDTIRKVKDLQDLIYKIEK